MRKYLSLIIIATILVCLPLAMYGESSADSKQLELNLEQAYKMIEDNNIEIKLIDKKIEMKQQEYNKALEAKNDAKGATSLNEAINLNYRKVELLNWQIVKLELDELQNERIEKLKILRYNVKNQYMNILLIQKDIKCIKEDIAVLDKKLAETKLRIALGQAKEKDYKLIYSQSLTLQNQMNSLEIQHESSMISLKKIIGVELSRAITVEDLVLPYQVLNKEDLNGRIKKAVDSDFLIVKINKELELKNLERQLVKDYTDYRYSTTYTDLGIDISEIETKLSYEKLNAEANLLIEYYDLLELGDNIKLEEVNLEIEKINYDTIEAKSKLGMIDSAIEINGRVAYNRQQNNYQRTMYNYILAVEKFNEKLAIK